MGEKRWTGALRGRTCDGGINATRSTFTEKTDGEIEPMNRKIRENQLRDLFESGAANPVMIPVKSEVDRCNLSDQARGDRLAHPGKVWRPTPVLIDRELASELIGQ
jgi:hypothetical protein